MRLSILLCLLFAVGCSGEERRPTGCPREEPAFRLELTTADAPLPDDTVLVVKYQGTLTEQYALSAPPSDNEDVCCRPGVKTTGTLPSVACGMPATMDAAPQDALLCELWTGGLAVVEVSADGYTPLDETLEPQMREDEECGLTTVDVRLVLSRTDGGVQ